MAVVAYASADNQPTTNPHVDAVIDLSAGGTIGAAVNVQLYGTALDSTDASPSFTFAWTLLSKPSGSAASLSSSTAQNPTLDAVDTWGNYRLMLVATNTNNSAVSETNALRAPSSAFVIVRVKSPNQGIQKPAPGERNWHDDIHVWADRIESFTSGFVAHNIVDHADVVDATGADLEQLTGGGYATDPAGTNPANPQGVSILHKHYGSDVDPATTSVRGTVVLDSAPADPAAPVVLANEVITLCGSGSFSFGSFKGAVSSAGFSTIGMQPGILDQRDAFPTTGTHGLPFCVWAIQSPFGAGVTVVDYSVFLTFEGHTTTHPPSPYQFELVRANSAANAMAHNWAPLGSGAGATLTQGKSNTVGVTGDPPTFQGEALLFSEDNVNGLGGLPVNVSNREWLGIACQQMPREILGAQMTVTIWCKRWHG